MPKPKPERVEPFAVAGVGDLAPELRDQLQARDRRRAASAKAKRPKATYDIPLAMIEAVQKAAGREGVSQSDIVAYALAEWLDKYAAGEVDLSDAKIPCRGLRFSLSLELPGKWRRSP